MVYDLLGREVARLLERRLEAGYHSVVWGGKNAAGAEVPRRVLPRAPHDAQVHPVHQDAASKVSVRVVPQKAGLPLK